MGRSDAKQRVAPPRTGGIAPLGLSGRPWVLVVSLVVLFAVVLAIHWPVLSATALCFDDEEYFLNNPLVRHPGWRSAWRFLSEVESPSTVPGYYQPLNMISLMVDAAFRASPDDIRPFRRTSLLLHAANTLLLALLLYRLVGSLPAALAIGLLFGTHPLTIEPLAWLGEHKTLLSTFFCLLAVSAYLSHAREPAPHWYWLSLAAFLGALLSKPTSIPLPLLLLVLDFWPLRRLSLAGLREKWPFFLLSAVFAVITVVSQRHLELSSIRPITAWQQILIICHNISFYLWKALSPLHLTPLYPFPEQVALSSTQIMAGVGGTAVVLILSLLSLRWTRACLAGLAFYVVALAPTLLNVPYSPGIASDKYAYWPLFGIFLILAAGASRLTAAARGRQTSLLTAVVLTLATGLAATQAVLARQQLRVWQDTETLCRHMIRLAPNEVHPIYNLALDLSRRNKVDEAMTAYQQCLDIDPDATDARNNLALLLVTQNRVDEAIGHYQTIIDRRPNHAVALNNLGMAHMKQEKYDLAVASIEKAVAAAPRYAKAHANLGMALERIGRATEAEHRYRRSLALNPYDPVAWNNLGALLARHGRIEEATPCFARAVQLDPDYPDARRNLEAARGLRRNDAGR